MEPTLGHGVSVKPVKILHDGRRLPLQHELTTLLEVQTGSIDHGKQHAIETGFVNVYGDGLDTRGGLDATVHKAVERGAVFSGGGGGGVRQKHKRGGLPGPLAPGNSIRSLSLATARHGGWQRTP